jgi:hypothetical protein
VKGGTERTGGPTPVMGRLDESTYEVKGLSASSQRNRATPDPPTPGGGWRHPRGRASPLHGLLAASDRRYFDMNALQNAVMCSSNGPSIHTSGAGWFFEPYVSDARVQPPRSDRARASRSTPVFETDRTHLNQYSRPTESSLLSNQSGRLDTVRIFSRRRPELDRRDNPKVRLPFPSNPPGP